MLNYPHHRRASHTDGSACYRLLPALLALLVLAACTTAPRPVVEDTAPVAPSLTEADARELLEAGDPQGAADVYYAIAADAASPERDEYLLNSAELLADIDLTALAVARLEEMQRDQLPAPLVFRTRILEARIALIDERPRDALRRLPSLEEEQTLAEQAQVLELRAEALQALAQIPRALQTRVQLEPLLANTEQIERNHERIWEILAQPGLLDLHTMKQATRGQVYRGWIELAEAVRGARLEQSSLSSAVNAWLLRYPAHPAADSFANQLLDEILADREYPHQIALLLPLTGRYANAAIAVRDGFLSAYFDAADERDRPEIRIYDVGDDTNRFWSAYNQALTEGARLIVGPLSKPAVNLVAAVPELAVPVLSLNYAGTDDSPAVVEQLYQFGLLPEDEARQSAEFAIESGYRRAVAIVPKGQWGARLLAAFQQTFENMGGRVIDHEIYASERNDFSAPIKRLLTLQLSQGRRSRVQRSLGTRVEFEPRRREDLDVIFLAAAPKNARLIKPQLKFHHAGDIPVYATSHVFTGVHDTTADKDMDGLLYLDIPLLLSSAPEIRATRELLLSNWPAIGERYLRLFALGRDAFALIPHLPAMRDNPDLTFAGLTGDLSMDTRSRVHRRLRWGLFEGGTPMPLLYEPLVSESVQTLVAPTTQ